MSVKSTGRKPWSYDNKKYQMLVHYIGEEERSMLAMLCFGFHQINWKKANKKYQMLVHYILFICYGTEERSIYVM